MPTPSGVTVLEVDTRYLRSHEAIPSAYRRKQVLKPMTHRKLVIHS